MSNERGDTLDNYVPNEREHPEDYPKAKRYSAHLTHDQMHYLIDLCEAEESRHDRRPEALAEIHDTLAEAIAHERWVRRGRQPLGGQHGNP